MKRKELYVCSECGRFWDEADNALFREVVHAFEAVLESLRTHKGDTYGPVLIHEQVLHRAQAALRAGVLERPT